MPSAPWRQQRRTIYTKDGVVRIVNGEVFRGAVAVSLDLQVDFTRPVSLVALMTALPPTLCELLDVRDVPPVHVAELRNGVSLPADVQALVDTERAWILGLVGHSEWAFFGGIQIEDHERGQQYHTHIWINSRFRRTPLEHALIAAIAVVVARIQQTRIVDHAQFFTPEIETEVEDFVRGVRVRGPFDDLVTAADAFYRRLFRALHDRPDA